MGESGSAVARTALDERSDAKEQVFRLIEQPGHPLVGDLVVHELASSLPPDEAALGQAGQVHRHTWLAETRAVDHLAYLKRAIPERLEHAEPRRISQSTKQLGPKGQGCRTPGLHHISYK